jgi:hypothetical protein
MHTFICIVYNGCIAHAKFPVSNSGRKGRLELIAVMAPQLESIAVVADSVVAKLDWVTPQLDLLTSQLKSTVVVAPQLKSMAAVAPRAAEEGSGALTNPPSLFCWIPLFS